MLVNTPKNKDLLFKLSYVARTDTTAKDLFVLPKGAVPVFWFYYGETASDAATTATVSVGNGSSATAYINAADVKTAGSATGLQVPTTKVGGSFAKLSADTVIKGVYAESGTASTTGGPWYVGCVYYTSEPGETVGA